MQQQSAPPPAQAQSADPYGQAGQDPYGQAGQNTPDGQGGETPDNPATQPAVGHISFIHGNVSIQRGDSGDWIAATLNTPLEAGDRVSTGDSSRAEVQLDYANIIRLDQNSTVKITNLNQGQIQVQVGEGLASYSVLPNNQADVEIDTPNSAIHPLRQGEYRVEIVNDSQSQITVRDGQAEVSEPQGSTRVEAGQLITIQGTDNPQYQVANASGPDDFDRWNDTRDHTITSAQSWQHTDRYYTGSQDLDAYGHWENVPDYGQVWVPDQDSGWAPYRDGNWEWEPYYGWTWVSFEPWGWAPYHYGRWFVYGGNWAWWPGPIGVYGGWGYRPIWAPAYVSFFGWGGGVSFGFGFGNIGWLALGPADFFHPWWGWGVTRVGLAGYVGFHDRFGWGGRGFGPLYRGPHGFSNFGRFDADARVRAGVSSIRGDQFGHGVGAFQHGMSSEQFHNANFMTGRVPAVPNRQSLGRVEDHVSPGIGRTAGLSNQHFFSQSRASSSFTQRSFGQEASAQQRMVEGSRGGQNGFSQRGGANEGFRGNDGAANRGASNGWHSFSDSGSRSTGQSGSVNRGSSNRGSAQPSRSGPGYSAPRSGNSNPWHQFTPPSNGGRGQQPSRSTSPRSGDARGESGYGGSRGGGYGNYSSRPQLDMRQPVANQRSYGGSSRGYGAYSGRSNSGNSRGSYGGSRSSGSRSSGGYRGGGSSRGSGGSHGSGSHGGSHGGGHPR